MGNPRDIRLALERAGRGHAAPVISLGRRAQSLYCAISLAKRRNKAIAPYLPSGPEPDFGVLPRSRNRDVGNSCVRTAANHNREKAAVKLGLISAAFFRFDLQPLNVSEIFLA